jgi:hypothetical protein
LREKAVTGRSYGEVFIIEYNSRAISQRSGSLQMPATPFMLPPDGDLLRARAALRQDVAKRLEKVCSDWPPDEFESIVDQVTDTTLKYAEPAGEGDSLT